MASANEREKSQANSDLAKVKCHFGLHICAPHSFARLGLAGRALLSPINELNLQLLSSVVVVIVILDA